jgi:hypothetical protein
MQSYIQIIDLAGQRLKGVMRSVPNCLLPRHKKIVQ